MKFLLISAVIALVICSAMFGYGVRSMECQYNTLKSYSDTLSIMRSKHDYSLEIESNDTIAIYDRDRAVGKILFTDDSEIGQLILKDNQ
jgi:hypothetical protein